MNFGVLTFSYTGFGSFDHALQSSGFYTGNLGDNTQTIAARELLIRHGVKAEEIVNVDRDTLRTYQGEPLLVIMSAMFQAHSLPPSPNIVPIFLGFTARQHVLDANLDYLKQHQPIGCRDLWTSQYLTDKGISSFVTGCITLTFEKRTTTPSLSKTFIIYGQGQGELPNNLIKGIPISLNSNIEFIYNRIPLFEFPIDVKIRDKIEKYEGHILDRIKNEATTVITSLHHIATPCIAMGIPIIIARKFYDDRFSLINQFGKIYYEKDIVKNKFEQKIYNMLEYKILFEKIIKKYMKY